MDLDNAVTHKDHRRQGLYKRLLLERLLAGQEHGAHFAHTTSDTSTSRPILEKLGFEEFDRTNLYGMELEN